MNGRNSYGIHPETFVAVWEESSSVKEVCGRLSAMCNKQVDRKAVSSRASWYRRQGVLLKTMGGKSAAGRGLA